MGVAKPGEVSAVHWTRFPAAALSDVDWSDHGDAHRGVMRLFARDLDGRAGHVRAANGVLYRVDLLGDEVVVLVQSAVGPELLPVGGRSMVVPAHAWTFDTGTAVAFRVAVNPVRRRTVRTSGADDAVAGQKRDRTGDKDHVIGTVPVEGMSEWLSARLAGTVVNLEVVNHFRDQTSSRRHKVVVDSLDCLAVVGDSQAFDLIRRRGVGRAKSYGCGLLTAQRTVA